MPTQPPPIILLAGFPATGKSYVGGRLEREKSFIHVDLEEAGSLQKFNLVSEWNHFVQTSNPASFVTGLHKLNQPVVLNWGFPPRVIRLVKALQKADLTLWWFNADPAASEKAFMERWATGGKPNSTPNDFAHQVSAINGSWDAIRHLFRPNIRTTVWLDESEQIARMPFQEICEAIMDSIRKHK